MLGNCLLKVEYGYQLRYRGILIRENEEKKTLQVKIAKQIITLIDSRII